MTKEVKYYTDRKGNKVKVGDIVGYFRGVSDDLLFSDVVSKITKSGSYIEVFVEGRPHQLSTLCLELLPQATESSENTQAPAGGRIGGSYE